MQFEANTNDTHSPTAVIGSLILPQLADWWWNFSHLLALMTAQQSCLFLHKMRDFHLL